MKYLKAENTEAAVNSYFTGLGVRGLGYAKTPRKVVHHQQTPEPWGIKFFSTGEQVLRLQRDPYATGISTFFPVPYFEYSYDGINWSEWHYEEIITETGYTDSGVVTSMTMVSFDELTFGGEENGFFIYIKGENPEGLHEKRSVSHEGLFYPSNYELHFSFETDSEVTISGNIASLLKKDGISNVYNYPPLGFCRIFRNATQITDVSNLIFPGTIPCSAKGGGSKVLIGHNFYAMFTGCVNLKTAPIFEVTELKVSSCNSMFYNCTSLTTAPELPAMTLDNFCYSYMFQDCAGLKTAPELPATTLATGCYNGMFSGCTSLVSGPSSIGTSAMTMSASACSGMFYSCYNLATAPELPVTTLANGCYSAMFKGCTSLITAPELPATTLVSFCYGHMFQGCTSLTAGPSTIGNSATTASTQACYGMFQNCTSLATAPELPATTLADSCYQNMFSGCTSLSEPPSILPATTLVAECYRSMFFGCKNISYTPYLPAETLVDWCYTSMFNGCLNLNNVACNATDVSSLSCTNSWLVDVSTTGSFYKNPNMSSWGSGSDGIPEGWDVYDIDW